MVFLKEMWVKGVLELEKQINAYDLIAAKSLSSIIQGNVSPEVIFRGQQISIEFSQEYLCFPSLEDVNGQLSHIKGLNFMLIQRFYFNKIDYTCIKEKT